MGTAQSQYEDNVNFSTKAAKGEMVSADPEEITANQALKAKERALRGKNKAKANRTKHDAIAIADLMAYLKVVATHANNLPLTRRDDPELGRTVSTLTAEEYAIKSKVFIPCNVKIIGATSVKYDANWVYPNRKDFDLSARVIGATVDNGGACCNALLKALYDSGIDEGDIMEEAELAAPENLFEDDEDSDFDDEKSLGSIIFDDDKNSSSTWANILRKMKGEMEELGYNQVPTICSSRRFDLEDSFSLVPNDFDSSRNKKLSLLVGCNYKNSIRLHNSHEDVQSVKDYIVNVLGFSDSKDYMTVLLDDGKHSPPTQANIMKALESIAKKSQPGDAIFVQFSGHGGRILDTGFGVEADCYDEVIIPSDFKKTGQTIRDTTLFKSFLAPMAENSNVTIVLDSCDTGVMFDLPYSWSTMHDSGLAKMSLNDNFSFVRFLKVLKRMYESTAYNESCSYDDGAIEYDSDDSDVCSLCTDDGNNDSDDDSDDEEESDEEEKEEREEEEVKAVVSERESVEEETDYEGGETEDEGEDKEKTDKDNGSMMSTIGGYFQPPAALQTQAEKLKKQLVDGNEEEEGKSKSKTTTPNSFFAAPDFVRTLSAKNLYSQVCNVLDNSDGANKDKEKEEEEVNEQPKVSLMARTKLPTQPRNRLPPKQNKLPPKKPPQHTAAHYDDNDSYDSFSDESESDSEDSFGGYYSKKKNRR